MHSAELSTKTSTAASSGRQPSNYAFERPAFMLCQARRSRPAALCAPGAPSGVVVGRST